LDYFEIDVLECKTSAMNFFNKLRRQTNNAFPHRVPVSLAYRENITDPDCPLGPIPRAHAGFQTLERYSNKEKVRFRP
jgi:hypothetical protein